MSVEKLEQQSFSEKIEQKAKFTVNVFVPTKRKKRFQVEGKKGTRQDGYFEKKKAVLLDDVEPLIADLEEKLEELDNKFDVRAYESLESEKKELEGRLSEIRKLVEEFLFEVLSAINLMSEDYRDLNKQYYAKNIKRLRQSYEYYQKKFEGLVGNKK